MTVGLAVSVLIPMLNAEHTIGMLLAALAGQAPNPLGKAEILVVDNGSSDASPRLVEDAKIDGLRLLREPRPGPSAARNRGMHEARGALLALLDADCVPTRNWLRELVAPFQRPEIVIVAGGLASYPPRTAAQRFAARYGLNEAGRSVAMLELPFANTRNMAVRTSVAREVGGWPEELTFGEDIEFSYRVRTRFGADIEFNERALAFHQDRESDEDLLRQAYNYGRGMAVLYQRHPDQLTWGTAQRVSRMRRSARRRLSAAAASGGARLRRVDPADAEFARYLAWWDRDFWRGFFDERRRPS